MAPIKSTIQPDQADQLVPTQATEETIPSGQLEYILKEIQKLKEENAELKKGQVMKVKDPKERYDGPRKYNYSTWGGIPVLDFESIAKDPTRDLMYQDQFNKWVSNQYLILILADGKKVSVEVNDFNRNRKRTEKMNCGIMVNKEGKTQYIFEDPNFGEIAVLSSVIN